MEQVNILEKENTDAVPASSPLPPTSATEGNTASEEEGLLSSNIGDVSVGDSGGGKEEDEKEGAGEESDDTGSEKKTDAISSQKEEHHEQHASDPEKAVVAVLEGEDEYPTQFNLKGEPIISSGHDVSRYLISIRDDGDEALTFRGVLIGTILNIVNNITIALFSVKPTGAGFSSIFLMLIIYIVGLAWAKVVPRGSSVAGKRYVGWLEKPLDFLNPGPFGLKEHVVAFMISSLGYLGGNAADTLATCKLYFNMPITNTVAVLGIFSLTIFGLGLLGVLQAMIVAPAEVVYWGQLSMTVTFQALHFDVADNPRRIKIFSWSLLIALFYEVIPAYMMPWLNGISIPCLASMKAPIRIRKPLGKVFGGALPNQGLGYFSLSFDPQYIGIGSFAGYPLKWLVQYFSGAIIGSFFLLTFYYTNAWNAKTYPFMASTLFQGNGSLYDNSVVFDRNYRLDETALKSYGLPHMSVAQVWEFMTTAMGLGGLVTHVLIFLSGEVRRDFQRARAGTLDDPHWQAMKKYKPVPTWFYIATFVLSVPAAFITISKGNTTLPWWGLVCAFAFGVFMTPISLSIYGRYGSAVPTMMASKTIAGAIHPGRPVANLWFNQYAHQVVECIGSLAANLKMGQYLKIPPRTNTCVQVYGALLGGYVQWYMISGLLDAHRDILLDPEGNRFWFGGYYQGLNAQAVQWSLASKVFGFRSGLQYEWIPMGFLIGACMPPLHWIAKRYIKIIRDAGELIATPIFMYDLALLGGGINSAFLSSMLVALFSQVWLRTRHPKIYIDLNYLVAAAIEGGVAICLFILSFAVFGAVDGITHLFPPWFGNPEEGSPDHCYLEPFAG